MPGQLEFIILEVNTTCPGSQQDKTLKLYEGLYHEIHNEPERLTMFKDLEAWLAAHV